MRGKSLLRSMIKWTNGEEKPKRRPRLTTLGDERRLQQAEGQDRLNETNGVIGSRLPTCIERQTTKQEEGIS